MIEQRLVVQIFFTDIVERDKCLFKVNTYEDLTKLILDKKKNDKLNLDDYKLILSKGTVFSYENITYEVVDANVLIVDRIKDDIKINFDRMHQSEEKYNIEISVLIKNV